jgi:hypothetical protein
MWKGCDFIGFSPVSSGKPVNRLVMVDCATGALTVDYRTAMSAGIIAGAPSLPSAPY